MIRQWESANPVILVDEIDKVSASTHNGSIRQTLLTMTEPVTARAWPDEALQAPVDLSQISWLATANDVTPLRGPLLTRFRVLEIGAPSAEHFEQVFFAVLREIAGELDAGVDDLPPLEPEAVTELRRAFARGWPIRRIRAAVEGASCAMACS